MQDPWIPILRSLNLSRTEREVVKRFEADSHGRAFLPVADILRGHRLIDESLELLTQGVERHPSFTVARVVLARELLNKGLVSEGFRTLEESPVSLSENLLAQKLKFRLALLLGLEPVVMETFRHMQRSQMLDSETRRFGEMVELQGLAVARREVMKMLRDQGINLVLPEEVPNVPHVVNPSATATATHTPKQIENELKGIFDDNEFEQDDLAGFHVVPLDEIFRPGDSAAPAPTGDNGVELDSTTLADIYAKQGHYAKALAVYRRLLRMTPNNDLLRRKVSELAQLEKEQRNVDLTVDPGLVDQMESIEIIDRQIKFYNSLLDRLT